MRAMKGALIVTLFLFLAVGVSHGKGLEVMADNELDGVYARGLNFIVDANSFLGGNTLNFSNVGNVTLPNVSTLNNSLFISGGAQQGSMGVVNAVNSAVNMPINIVVLINSTAMGGININNLLSAVNK
ncbi:MAG: hypothetical protein A4E57_00217 [Syntrophorhabdaceae bacterium PtaU1.Bin034]|jgi:hypothetical protein|nr:MAG: hypothetical protein A4E57_00217 [Syntrophorhabdaceae bacterium PtaU1.Bin034]